jgi:hypothetical protein
MGFSLQCLPVSLSKHPFRFTACVCVWVFCVFFLILFILGLVALLNIQFCKLQIFSRPPPVDKSWHDVASQPETHNMVGWPVGYKEFDFFKKKIKNKNPLMGAQFKSKTHLRNKFFDFWRRFLRVWLQSLKKY